MLTAHLVLGLAFATEPTEFELRRIAVQATTDRIERAGAVVLIEGRLNVRGDHLAACADGSLYAVVGTLFDRLELQHIAVDGTRTRMHLAMPTTGEPILIDGLDCLADGAAVMLGSSRRTTRWTGRWRAGDDEILANTDGWHTWIPRRPHVAALPDGGWVVSNHEDKHPTLTRYAADAEMVWHRPFSRMQAATAASTWLFDLRVHDGQLHAVSHSRDAPPTWWRFDDDGTPHQVLALSVTDGGRTPTAVGHKVQVVRFSPHGEGHILVGQHLSGFGGYSEAHTYPSVTWLNGDAAVAHVRSAPDHARDDDHLFDAEVGADQVWVVGHFKGSLFGQTPDVTDETEGWFATFSDGALTHLQWVTGSDYQAIRQIEVLADGTVVLLGETDGPTRFGTHDVAVPDDRGAAVLWFHEPVAADSPSPDSPTPD